MVLLKIFFRRDKPSSAILAMAGKLWLAVLCARHTLACRLQNNDCFVPKPLRFKCLRILSLFCVICARRKNASAFSALLVVSHGPWVQPQSAAHCTQCAKSHRQRQQNPFHAFTPLLNKQWDSLRNASIAITPGRATIHRSVAFSARSNPTLRCETKTKAPCSRCLCFRWRRRWDSNPRTGNPVN